MIPEIGITRHTHCGKFWTESCVVAGACPDSACLVTDDDEQLLLCLHASKAARVSVLRLLPDAPVTRVQVICLRTLRKHLVMMMLRPACELLLAAVWLRA